MAKLRNEKPDTQENISIAELKEVQEAVRAHLTTSAKLPSEEIIKNYDKLVAMATVWNDAYWDDNPVVPDNIFDELVSLIGEIELMIPNDMLNPKSPVNKIGSKRSDDDNATNVTHMQPMLSLKRASDHNNVFKALQSMQNAVTRAFKDCQMGIDYDKGYVLEPKLDGVALEVVYEKKRGSFQRYDLAYAALRGNGKEGMDVTHIVKEMDSVPAEIFIDPDKFDETTFSVYGEVCAPFYHTYGVLDQTSGIVPESADNSWEKYTGVKSEDNGTQYASARHLASAIMRSHDVKMVERYDPVFIAYETAQSCYYVDTRVALTQALKSLGFNTINASILVNDNIGDVCNKAIRESTVDFDVIRSRENRNSGIRDCGFQTDGVVIKLNSLDACCRVGDNGKKPNWALAVKQPTYYETTTLEDVTWTIGRQGVLTPIAWVKPVTLNGVVCSKVKLGNPNHIKRDELHIGDKVVVTLSGDAVPIIRTEFAPEVDARKAYDQYFQGAPWTIGPVVAEPKEKITLPTHCPCCNHELTGRDGAYLICPNTDGCEDQIVARLVHFASPSAVNIRYVGEQIIRGLVKYAGIKTPQQLADISVDELDRVEPPIQRDKLGLVRAIRSRITTAIDEKPANVIFGLSIPGVGKTLADELIGVYGNIASILLRTPETIAETCHCRLSTAKDLLSTLRSFMELGSYQSPSFTKDLQLLESIIKDFSAT